MKTFFKQIILPGVIAIFIFAHTAVFAAPRDTLAPKSGGFGGDSEIMQTARARKLLERFSAVAAARLNSAASMQERMQIVRDIRRVIENPRENLGKFAFVAEDQFDPGFLPRVYNAAAETARRLAAQLLSAPKNDQPYLSRVYFHGMSATGGLDEYLFSAAFSDTYGVSFRRGERLFIDFAGGMPPVASQRLALKAKKANPGIVLEHFESEYPGAVLWLEDGDRAVYFNDRGEVSHVFSAAGTLVPFNDRTAAAYKRQYDEFAELARKVLSSHLLQDDREFMYFEKERYEHDHDNLKFKTGDSSSAPAGVDLIRAINIPRLAESIPGVAESELILYEAMLKDRGILIAGWDRFGFGQFFIFQKRDGRLVPVEMVFAGVDKNQLAALAGEGIDIVDQRVPALSNEIGRCRLLDDVSAFDFRLFFPRLVDAYLIAAQYPDTSVVPEENVRRMLLGTILQYSRLGYAVAYDSQQGLMRFSYDANGNLHPLAAVLAKAGVQSISAYRAFMPLVRYLAARENRGVGEYCRLLVSDPAAFEAFRKIVVDAVSGTGVAGTRKTWFFRDYGTWGGPLRDYVDALIRSKIERDDTALTVKCIGAASGKEAYSIGAVIYSSLLRVARERYGYASDEAAEQWMRLWDIRLEAYDKDMSLLDVAATGAYPAQDLFDDDRRGLSAAGVLKDFFSSWEEYLVVKPIMRDWLRPVYVDLNDPALTAAVLGERPGDIIFARNVLFTLNEDAKAGLIAAMRRGAFQVKEYPAFYFTDRDDLFETIKMLWVDIPRAFLDRLCGKFDNDYGQVSRSAGVSRVDVMIARAKGLADTIDFTAGGEALAELLELERELKAASAAADAEGKSSADINERFRLVMIRSDVDSALTYIDSRFPQQFDRKKSAGLDMIRESAAAAETSP
jgi:chemotaxis methyl-accepting protein methylase